MVEIFCFDHREHGSKDLLLLDRRAGLDVIDHRWLDKETVLVDTAATRDDLTSFALALLYVLKGLVESALVDDRRHARVGFGRLAGLQVSGQLDNLLDKRVMDLFVHDQTRTRRAFLTLKAKCGLDRAVRR